MNIKRYYNIDIYTWRRICAFYDNKCLCCKEYLSPEDLTVDHVKPVSLGGNNSIRNYQPLCMTCNRNKNNKTIDYRWDRGRCLIKHLEGGPLITQFSLDESDQEIEGQTDSELMEIFQASLQPFAEAMNVLAEVQVQLREAVDELQRRINNSALSLLAGIPYNLIESEANENESIHS